MLCIEKSKSANSTYENVSCSVRYLKSMYIGLTANFAILRNIRIRNNSTYTGRLCKMKVLVFNSLEKSEKIISKKR